MLNIDVIVSLRDSIFHRLPWHHNLPNPQYKTLFQHNTATSQPKYRAQIWLNSAQKCSVALFISEVLAHIVVDFVYFHSGLYFQ